MPFRSGKHRASRRDAFVGLAHRPTRESKASVVLEVRTWCSGYLSGIVLFALPALVVLLVAISLVLDP
jgi:hypothetical protein